MTVLLSLQRVLSGRCLSDSVPFIGRQSVLMIITCIHLIRNRLWPDVILAIPRPWTVVDHVNGGHNKDDGNQLSVQRPRTRRFRMCRRDGRPGGPRAVPRKHEIAGQETREVNWPFKFYFIFFSAQEGLAMSTSMIEIFHPGYLTRARHARLAADSNNLANW